MGGKTLTLKTVTTSKPHYEKLRIASRLGKKTKIQIPTDMGRRWPHSRPGAHIVWLQQRVCRQEGLRQPGEESRGLRSPREEESSENVLTRQDVAKGHPNIAHEGMANRQSGNCALATSLSWLHVVPIHQGWGFRPRSGHIQESIHEWISKWNSK